MRCAWNQPPIPDEVLERVADVLRVLGHPHRLRLVEMLERESQPVGQLAEQLGIPPHACSQHLRVMQARGILSSHREGKQVFYKVEDPQAHSVINCIKERLK